MRTKLIYSNQEDHPGYGSGSGDTEVYEYENMITYQVFVTILFLFVVMNAESIIS